MSAIWRTLYRATFNINTRLKRSLAPVAKPRAQAMCLVNFQPDEEIGSSCAAEDSCAAEILIFDCRLDNLGIVATGRENF